MSNYRNDIMIDIDDDELEAVEIAELDEDDEPVGRPGTGELDLERYVDLMRRITDEQVERLSYDWRGAGEYIRTTMADALDRALESDDGFFERRGGDDLLQALIDAGFVFLL